MKKFMLLYIGPYRIDVGMKNPPVTQAGVDEWAQKVGDNLVDRGTLFGADGKSAIDRGDVTQASIPMQGYAVVQANSIDEAVSLTRGHPILANGKQGYFEIQVMELISGDIPLDATSAIQLPSSAAPPQQASSATPQPAGYPASTGAGAGAAPADDYQPGPDGELDISHDEQPQPDQQAAPQDQPGQVVGPGQEQDAYGTQPQNPAYGNPNPAPPQGPYQPQQNPQQQGNMPLPPSQQGPPPPLPPRQRQGGNPTLNKPDDPLVM